jgi:CYTH domain-containing protein
MQEIERKFLAKSLPDLSGKECISYERYFLKIESDFEERIQKKGDKYEKERKFKTSNLSRETEKQEISKEDFDVFKKSASKSIIRDSYKISDTPNITIKIYHGDYEGLIRVEVEFSSEEEAKNFQSYDWMGKEITDTKLGKDAKLIQLTKKEFKDLLDSLK